MIRKVGSFSSLIPRNGLALHGKPVMYLADISRNGLIPHSREEVYFCPLPPGKIKRMGKAERFERLVGSILHATTWAVRGNVADHQLSGENLPALLILRGTAERPFIGSYGEGEKHGRFLVHPNYPQLFGRRFYRSFGVHTEDNIPASQIAGVVQLTKEEHKRIIKKVGANHSAVYGEIQKLLVFKTLRKLRGLLRKIRKEERASR